MLTYVLLAGILLALIVLIVSVRRRPAPISTSVSLDVGPEVEAAIERLGAAANHYTDVSAVVKMVHQLDTDPDALELIKSYPETVRAAAWLHYINGLGATLQHLQNREATDRRNGIGWRADQTRDEIAKVRKQFDAAIAASGQSGLRSI